LRQTDIIDEEGRRSIDAVAICPNILTDSMSIFTKVVEIVCWSNMKKTES
jgi:hypothetical protein